MKDWFYPDFICQLTDGRVLAVEYKGKHLYDGNDAEEKRTVGAVWASRSGGRCLFVMPTEGDFSVIHGQLRRCNRMAYPASRLPPPAGRLVPVDAPPRVPGRIVSETETHC